MVWVNDTLLLELEEHGSAAQYKARWTKFISFRVKFCLQLHPYNTINLDSSWPASLVLTVQEPVCEKPHKCWEHHITRATEGHYTATGETEKAMQRFLMTRHDIGGENIPAILLSSFPEKRHFQLTAVCQTPQSWKHTGNNTTTRTLEGRSYLKP